MNSYELLDSGNGQKWERFGSYTFCRPSAQAVWLPKAVIKADAHFSREDGSAWTFHKKLPPFWEIELEGVKMKVAPGWNKQIETETK